MALLCKEVVIRLLLPPLLHHVRGHYRSGAVIPIHSFSHDTSRATSFNIGVSAFCTMR